MDKRFLEIAKDPILITGCARSGTSMCAGVINICGAFGGKLSRGNRYNQKGMFENAYIRDVTEKGYLRSIGMDPLGQQPLPETNNMLIPRNWKKTVDTVMIKEGYKNGPWFYKGAKACLIWPIWHYAYPDAKWLIVRREREDIVNSCMRTGFMHKRTTREQWLDWVDHHERMWEEMIKAGCDVKMVWPDKMVYGNYTQMKNAVEWLGLEWKHEEVIQFVDPKLWKARQKDNGK